MTERPRILTEDQVAELVTWAMCEMAEGGGQGCCDPLHCVCGAEGKFVAKKLYGQGYKLHIVTEQL